MWKRVRVNFFPYIHALVAEGGTVPHGTIHSVSRFHDGTICDRFTFEIFSLLLQEKLIGFSFLQRILRWRYTGFNVHSKVRAQS
jgi:hypothetical protein